jgi:hypothetical protein
MAQTNRRGNKQFNIYATVSHNSVVKLAARGPHLDLGHL